MVYEVVLTVPESKRLIAKAVHKHSYVITALKKGTIALCKGTTCSYIAEEFLGHPIEPFTYTTGLTLPHKPEKKIRMVGTKLNDIIIKNGIVTQDGTTAFEAARTMKAGDVIIKGANALSADREIAGCLVGHPEGGYFGSFIGHVYGKKLRLIIPVGLEKTISGNLLSASHHSFFSNGPTLMPMVGIIITEIEAFDILCGVGAFQLASGGVRGAEGSTRLLLEGKKDQIENVKKILSGIYGEQSF